MIANMLMQQHVGGNTPLAGLANGVSQGMGTWMAAHPNAASGKDNGPQQIPWQAFMSRIFGGGQAHPGLSPQMQNINRLNSTLPPNMPNGMPFPQFPGHPMTPPQPMPPQPMPNVSGVQPPQGIPGGGTPNIGNPMLPSIFSMGVSR